MHASPPALIVQTSFAPPKSPVLKPTLRKRLFAEPARPDESELQSKLDAAARRKNLLVRATVESVSAHNKRAKSVACQQKEQQKAAAAHRMSVLSARLDAAAERRLNSRNASPTSSPAASPRLSPTAGPSAPSSNKITLSVALPADDGFALPVVGGDVAMPSPNDESPRPLHEEIAAHLAMVGGEFEQLAAWIKEPATIGLVAEWLASLGIDRTLAKRLLALVYMAQDSEGMFDDSEADKIMAREAARFKKMLARQLKRGVRQATKETFEESFTRARRFYTAWSAQDIPKQALVVDEALQRLTDAMMRVRAQQMHEGAEPAAPEDILAQIRALGGEAAEAAARAQFAQPWEGVTADGLEARVREAATRALWDTLKAHCAAGEYGALFGMLGELQQAMGALVSHSARATAELADHFDAKWIEQQAGAGCLEAETVHGLMRYLIEKIGSMQAPADDAEYRAWAAGVEANLASAGGMALPEFITAHLIDFLAGAMERLGTVYKRMIELSGQMDSLRETAAALDAQEAREGAVGSQD